MIKDQEGTFDKTEVKIGKSLFDIKKKEWGVGDTIDTRKKAARQTPQYKMVSILPQHQKQVDKFNKRMAKSISQKFPIKSPVFQNHNLPVK